MPLYNRAHMTVASAPGVGDATLGTRVSPAALTFADAGVPDGMTDIPCVFEDGSDFELSRCTYLAAGPTLVRNTVVVSQVGGVMGTTKLNLSADTKVFIDAMAQDILLPQDNLAALADKDTALTNLGGGAGGIPIFKATTPAEARAASGADVLRSWNWVINGDFTVNQRGGTRTPGAGVYGYDRWKGHANGLEQVIEALPAGEYTLTWTGGGTGTFAGTTAASPIKATSAGGNVSVVVPSNASKVSLVAGDATLADPWQKRLTGIEMLLCQRYFQVIRYGMTNGSIPSAGINIAVTVMFPVPMRATPTSSSWNSGNDSFPGPTNVFELDHRHYAGFRTSNSTSNNANWYETVALNAEF